MDAKLDLVKDLAKEVNLNHIQLKSCSMELDASDFGVGHAKCVDDEIFESIVGRKLHLDYARKEAGCIEALDIGKCENCPSGCKYCFAQPEASFT